MEIFTLVFQRLVLAMSSRMVLARETMEFEVDKVEVMQGLEGGVTLLPLRLFL